MQARPPAAQEILKLRVVIQARRLRQCDCRNSILTDHLD